MIDLHLHLDGSLSPELAGRLAREQGVLVGDGSEGAVKNLLQAPPRCKDLNDYLTRFELPLRIMQTRPALFHCAADLIRRLNEQHMIYAEIRFAPQLHTRQGLSMEDAVRAVADGMTSEAWSGAARPRLILCLMRGDHNHAENMETVRLAAACLGCGVAAVDLAGAEALYPTAWFEEEFALARKLNVPFTIHAGEAAGADSIRAAMRFGARRIGHGVHIVQDEQLLKMAAESGILLEMCPTSNIQTGAVEALSAHPLARLLRSGMPVCVNTDNMTVSDTDIKNEFARVCPAFDLSKAEQRQLLVYAVEGAFVSDSERRELLRAVEERMGEFCSGV